MKSQRFRILIASLAVLFAPAFTAWPRPIQDAQQNPPASPDHSAMPGMDMDSMKRENESSPAARSANRAMSAKEMHMDAHMFMTSLRPPNRRDQQRADEILAALIPAIERYKDYRVALEDGFHIFLPNVPQAQYHFNNWQNALDAEFDFDPARPTSLLYKKTKDGFELEGAMYTAPRRSTEDELNARVPLSVARWHEHVNLCMPPRGAGVRQTNWHEFGLRGSIATKQACEDAGGRWIPQIFNWMVHVYPFEKDPAKIWAH